MTRDEAELGYLKWTNNLLTRWRTYATRHDQEWYYCQVTERQKRGHPHSHIITTFQPPDLSSGKKRSYKVQNDGNKRYVETDALRSTYVRDSCVDAGLGDQYDISRVQSVEGASRYVAKYLFKPTIFTAVWPKGWKRIRYSQGFPKLEKKETDGFILITREDWRKLGELASVITVSDYVVGEIVKHHVPNNQVLFR